MKIVKAEDSPRNIFGVARRPWRKWSRFRRRVFNDMMESFGDDPDRGNICANGQAITAK